MQVNCVQPCDGMQPVILAYTISDMIWRRDILSPSMWLRGACLSEGCKQQKMMGNQSKDGDDCGPHCPEFVVASELCGGLDTSTSWSKQCKGKIHVTFSSIEISLNFLDVFRKRSREVQLLHLEESSPIQGMKMRWGLTDTTWRCLLSNQDMLLIKSELRLGITWLISLMLEVFWALKMFTPPQKTTFRCQDVFNEE